MADVPALKIVFSHECLVQEDEDNYLTHIDARVRAIDDAGEEDGEAGRISMYVADIDGAGEAGIDPHSILDHCGATEPLYSLLFDRRTERLKGDLERSTFGRNLLVISHLALRPRFRGRRLGLGVVFRCVQQFIGSHSLCLLDASPLHPESGPHRLEERDAWHESLELTAFDSDVTRATNRLKSYFGMMGFEQLGDSEFLVLPTGLKRPSLAALGLD